MGGKSRIGDILFSLRTTKGLGLTDVSVKAGIPSMQLEAIEKGQAVPSLGPLQRIAKALDVRLGVFFDGEPTKALVVTRAGKGPEAIRFGGKSSIGTGKAPELEFLTLAADKADRHMEPFIVHIDPKGDADGLQSSHEGEEFIYVISGSVRLKHGTEDYTLGTGDSAYYESVVPHVLSSASDGKATVLAVLYAPL